MYIEIVARISFISWKFDSIQILVFLWMQKNHKDIMELFHESSPEAENKSSLQNMSLNIDQKGSIKRKKHEIKNRGGKRKGESHELRTASLSIKLLPLNKSAIGRTTITIYIFTHYLEKTKLLQLDWIAGKSLSCQSNEVHILTQRHLKPNCFADK